MIVAGALGVASGALAQSTAGWDEYQSWETVERAGDWRLSVSGALSLGEVDFDSGGSVDGDTYTLNIGAGYFIAESHELGFELGLLGVDVEDSDATILIARPRYSFHLVPSGPVDPYLGARGGIAMVDGNLLGLDDSDTGYTVGVFGGLNFFVSESVSIFAELGYDFFEFDESEYDEVRLTLGVSLFF
jgi:hypothetical protein